MKVILSILFSLYVLNVSSQTNDSLEVVIGLEKYKKEVLDICKSYSKILDSLQNDRIQKMTKDSLYSQNELKNRPEKYKGYDGGIIGYLMEEEDRKIKDIINKFLKIDRLSGSSKGTYSNGQTEYKFNYYRTVKDPDGSKRLIRGVVIWVED